MQEKAKISGILDYLKEKKMLPLIIGGILLGISLLILGSAGSASKDHSTDADALSVRAEELSAIEAKMEKEIETLCESVAGVSDAAVMISFSRGHLVEYTVDAEGNPITVGNGSTETAVFSTLEPPAVMGVGIVCRGGGNAEIQRILTELVSTALGISSGRVYIAGK